MHKEKLSTLLCTHTILRTCKYLDHYIETRTQASFLTHDELDLVLLGYIESAALLTTMIIMVATSILLKETESQWNTSIVDLQSAGKLFSSCMVLVKIDSKLWSSITLGLDWKHEFMVTPSGPQSIVFHIPPRNMWWSFCKTMLRNYFLVEFVGMVEGLLREPSASSRDRRMAERFDHGWARGQAHIYSYVHVIQHIILNGLS